MTKIVAWIALVAWVGSAAVVGVLFFKGQTETAVDGRQAITLTPEERDIVLTEMRTMLGSVRDVVAGLADGDMKAVIDGARTSGSNMQTAVPPALMLKLPMAFKELGFSAHSGFDEIVVAAQQGETPDMILAKLGEQLGRCVSCHAEYRLP
ncbi:MAG: hypothetical protein OQJ76_04660 [Rhodospirillales bacterium]|nr:hypothetical protein [Rhodospirillales bacterium]